MAATVGGTHTREDVHQIGIEGYVYLYPLVTMEITRRRATTGPADPAAGRGPMGAFHHLRSYPAADFKAVVRPNFDTLYSSAWLDVGGEPMIVSAPASDGRFYMLPCLDMWTDVFASPGTRTNGSDLFTFALSSPQWRGSLPEGVERIDAPTPIVWIIGRIQTNGPDDYSAVRQLQDQLTISPLPSWGGTAPTPEPVEDPSVDRVTPPLEQVHALSAAEYFALGADLIAQQPPHLTDWGQLARLRRIGFVVGQPFDLGLQSEVVQEVLPDVPVDSLAMLIARLPTLAPIVNGWLYSAEGVGVYGDDYVKRAVVAMVGLGANQPEDALYPALQADTDGQPLDGANRYVMRFEADGLPPVDAFWSVTMYDAHGFQAANELDRFAIGDRDDLYFNADGSLELYLQHENPGPEKVANWLPAPRGPLGVTMRMYLPRQEAFSGAWRPPPVTKVE